jgi:flagellar basal body-associated protein FliL
MEEKNSKRGIFIIIGIVVLVVLVGVGTWYFLKSIAPAQTPQALSPQEQLQQRLDALRGDATTTPNPTEIKQKLKELSGKGGTPAVSTVDLSDRLKALQK